MREKMSLLDNVIDKIKNLLGNNNSDQVNKELEEIGKTVEAAPETIPEVAAKIIPEIKIEPESVAKPKPKIKEKPVAKKIVEPIATATKESKNSSLNIPEDSTLKRHFLSNLKSKIESEMPPRPTDSTLKRHYDTQVQAKLETLLT